MGCVTDAHLLTTMFPLQESPPPPSAFFGGEGSPGWCSGDRPPGHHGPVARRNERERKRVRLVNMGFAKLRQYIPSRGRPGKRLSKVETLRSAIDYIRQLRQLLRQPDPPYYFPPPPSQLHHQPQQRLAADFRCDFGCPCNDSPLPTEYVFEAAPDYAMMAYPQDTYVM